MKLVYQTRDLLALLTPEGAVREPVRVAAGARLHDLTAVTSLAGITLGEGCGLYGLTAVTSLAGLTLGKGCVLYGLTTLAGLDLTPTEEEVAILRQIPIDRVDMATWHSACGTSHCLAGWAHVLGGSRAGEKPLAAGRRLLPTLAPFFWTSTPAVREYLEGLHAATN